MTNHHPIVPSPEQVDQWFNDAVQLNSTPKYYIATQAAQWGSDQELEACCEWVSQFNYDDYSYQERLRAARRRPKPPSLKEQAKAELDRLIALIPAEGALAMAEPIRRALEALDD